ncbi:2-amino-4-hydroxy-6-hydroxymethyldihydropteridine diphosphokinase [Parendozoicomonas sp. Alg238-R29]|uniref:2-amino-4-hydroxy-6- hydroxymethyldihydropteridine diphosphokinase n=1 Tax=Parendozoicomonas sp. Alg238-R29 TaxID=2993446 RepID=UPI00248EF8F8|nr:2-amino-4-hydroxy-6-hydroxymethyldihydropteridine diphosphokinase [Parendozoicomonas sp. Alg238-R29]
MAVQDMDVCVTEKITATKYRYMLGLGSNEYAEVRLPAIVDALLRECGALHLSPVCRTAPSHGKGPDYLNAIVSLESVLPPTNFRTLCKSIEASLGRVRPSDSCAADIDILAVWNQPEKTCAVAFIDEAYLQPMADAVLESLELYDGESPKTFKGFVCVPVILADQRVVGIQTTKLSSF